MDWNDLRPFLAVARSGGLSGAARALGTSAQTVGRRIAAMEAALGTMLFLRRPTGYLLTEDGVALLANAERIEADMGALIARASGRAAGLSGTVRLAAPETLTTHVLLPALGPFLERHPDLELELVTGIASVGIARGDADLAIRLVQPERGALTVRRIGQVEHALYAALPLIARQPSLIADPFTEVRLIGWTRAHDDLTPARWLKQMAKREPDLRLTSLAAQAAAVRAGLGVAVLPTFLGEHLEQIPSASAPCEPLWLVSHAGAVSDRVRAVRDAVTDIVGASSWTRSRSVRCERGD